MPIPQLSTQTILNQPTIHFFNSTKEGNLKEVQRLLTIISDGIYDVKTVDDKIITIHSHDDKFLNPIFHAALRENIEIMELLLQNGAQPNSLISQGANQGCSVLFMCVEQDLNNSVKCLLNAGADPNLMFQDFSPLNHYWMTQHLSKIKFPTIEVAELLLNAGADPNNIAPNRICPLYAAVDLLNNYELVSLLIKNNALKEQGFAEFTPLYRAVLKGDCKMVDVLVKNGCNVNAGG